MIEATMGFNSLLFLPVYRANGEIVSHGVNHSNSKIENTCILIELPFVHKYYSALDCFVALTPRKDRFKPDS